ncbi:hypothetical protein MED222_05590 [Vibrio sp. MED222]|nr:hypothetical protein MED222_05590 [Vibrio sp. MED222]
MAWQRAKSLCSRRAGFEEANN